MPDGGRGLLDVAEGLGLLLQTQSFAVRALLGSLAAAALTATVVRVARIRSPRARRVLVLAPIGVAATAAVASVGEQFLPQLVISTTSEAGSGVLELLGFSIPQRQVNLLVVAYAALAAFFVLRRVAGILATRRVVRRAVPAPAGDLRALVRTNACAMGIAPPRVLLLRRCPGGAFATGIHRPAVVVDPALLRTLDAQELEGLVAHELAHLARRDPLLGVVAGFIRDLAFFLPPLHVACRWLRREQEESADELASRHTRRPAALASSILKVYEASRTARGAPLHCGTVVAAMVPARLAPSVAGARVPSRSTRGARAARAHGAAVVAARVERLIAAVPSVSTWRGRGELALAAAVLALATAAALVLPAHLPVHGDLLLGYYELPEPAGAVESPAMATFRALAPVATEDVWGVEDRPAVDRSRCDECLLVESRAELARGTAAQAPVRASGWYTEGYRPWEDRPAAPSSRAEPLLSLGDDSRLGFFVVTSSAPSERASR